MAELLKNMFNYESLYEIAAAIQTAYSSFMIDEFLKAVMDETWDGLELKARGRKISTTLGRFLPVGYQESLDILEKTITSFPVAFFFPDFIEVYGHNDGDWDLSVETLGRTTKYWSAEFAIRSFIIKDEKRLMKKMYEWSKHEDEHVRRLASEGCRPALPWGQALVKYKLDPTPILPILINLKSDPSLYVRKSVANNLNDISKTHPDLVLGLAKDWYGKNDATNWIIKHGLRTLLKKGNRNALALFGFHDVMSISVTDFSLNKSSVPLAGNLTFSFAITTKEASQIRLEYGVDYVKSSGKTSRKIFQISESFLNENTQKFYTKKHSFSDLSTRKHYPGIHSITLIVNGVERGTLDFELFN